MRNKKRTHAIKAALFSLLGILLLTGLYMGVNRFIFASATEREHHLEPFLPMESATSQVTLLTRLQTIPAGYPFPEFEISVPEGVEEMMAPNTMPSDQAAVIVSKYIWEMHGTDISGKTMFLGLETFPSSTRTFWQGLIWSYCDVVDFIIHYNFTIDSVTGERISISINDWFPSGNVGEDISGGCHETLVAFYTEIARDFAERHFHFTTVESVTYEGMRQLEHYQNSLVCMCREPNPCPTQTAIFEEYMYYYELGCPMLESRFGPRGIPTIQCTNYGCSGGINQPLVFIGGPFPCHTIMNGETLMDFIATDDTGRSARISVSMESRRLTSLCTQHNDIIPGFDAQPDWDSERLPGPHDPALPLYPYAGPFLTIYLGPDQPAWAVQIQPSTDFHTFADPLVQYSSPDLNLYHDPNWPLDWQFINMNFSHDRIPISVSVVRRRVNDVGAGAALESVDLTIPGGWVPGFYEYAIPVFDNGHDYYYFVRTVWPEGYAFHFFRLNSGSHPDVGTATPPQIPNPTPLPDGTQQGEDINVPIPAGTVWNVLPTIRQYFIKNCNCGQFVNQDWQIIDPATGEIIGDHLGHGGPPPSFVYDRELGLFGHPGYGFGYHDLLGMHPIDEFMQMIGSSFADFDWWRNPTEGLIAIEAVDSTRRIYNEREYLNQYDELVTETFWDINPGARTSRFALMNDREFVTGFDFDGVNIHYPHYTAAASIPSLIAVSQNGMWGLANWNGHIIIPLVFENLVIIENTPFHATAFARYNGRYGILDIFGTSAALGDA